MLLTLPVLIVASSCSTPNVSPEDGEKREGTGAADSGVNLVDSTTVLGAYANPLDPITHPDATKERIIAQAYNSTLKQCMEGRGFEYIEGMGELRRSSESDAQYVYSVTDPQVAAVYGFHPQSWVEDAIKSEARLTEPSPSVAYTDALYGDMHTVKVFDQDGVEIGSYDPESCVGVANDTVRPNWAEERQLDALAWEISLAVNEQSTPEVIEGFAAWSVCMKDSGFEYATPWDANNEFDSNLPTAPEIEVAVASAECQQSTGLIKTWSRVRAELVHKELEKHPGIITRWNEIQQESLSLVEKVQ
ncbi:hypothetical protein V5R04_09910 [Jonesiaceae bacterium BS-20]|uniref:Lipoprotein n=1 Tax=Jonesiaceae bacterium BS-20 TaxID=3120821 RepID=A0AAU7DTC7_9MICO